MYLQMNQSTQLRGYFSTQHVGIQIHQLHQIQAKHEQIKAQHSRIEVKTKDKDLSRDGKVYYMGMFALILVIDSS